MRHAIVTGASSGIGRAAALALKERGFEVWGGVRNDAAAADVESAGIHPLLLDVTDRGQVADAAGMVLAKSGGKLAALVNNAGIAVTDPWEIVTDEDLARQFDVNIFGLHRVTRTFLPAIIAAKGRIVNMGSIAGRIGLPFMGPYSASKHALEGYTDSLRREMRPLGVGVSIVEPGMVATPIWEKNMPPEGYVDTLPEHYRELGEAALARAAQGHTGIPAEDVAAVIVHAASSRFAKARYALPMREKVLSRLGGLVPEFVMDRVIEQDLRRSGDDE